MTPRTLELQNQIRSTTSGIEFDDTLDLSFAETLVNEETLTDPAEVSGTLVMDLNYIRTALRDIKGTPSLWNWHDSCVSAGLITLSGARESLNNVHNFIGSGGDLDATPTYSSTNYVTQNVDLETAIGELDASIQGVNEIKKRKLIRTAGFVSAGTTIDINTPGADWTSSGDTIEWSSAGSFVEDVSVFHNGQLLLPGSGTGDKNDVYYIASPDSLAFDYNIRKNDVIQVWQFPPT